jgi:hypothetical protein
LDRNFVFSKDLTNAWRQSYPEGSDVLPEAEGPLTEVGNYIDMVEAGIKYGFVVQRHGITHKVHFNNARSYDLTDLPPHVFFDGTMLDNRFITHKLRGVQLEEFKIPVNIPWTLSVSQNINTDITKKALFQDQPKVKKLITEILNQNGKSNKYLIVSNKPVSEYLHKFIGTKYSDYHVHLEYFGNLRGENRAQDCNIGIMLGSFLPSDAVEITMALDLIQDSLPEKPKVRTENSFWVWEGSKGYRVYKQDYQIIEDLARAYRWSEQRQAMARTRYLFHDVHFYVFSKDRVFDYEKYAKVITDKHVEDIFLPRKERKDSKYKPVKEMILALIDENGSLIEADLLRLLPPDEKGKRLSPRTLRKHLKRMVNKRCLTRGRGKAYFRP